MKMKLLLLPLAVVGTVVGLVTWAARSPEMSAAVSIPKVGSGATDDLAVAVADVNRHFESLWQAEQLAPAQPADELQILRRLSLCLHGTIPSLEMIRQFEADKDPDRIDRWANRMLVDDRFGDYFAERLGRSFVGVEGGAFIIFRRDRFIDWLAGQLKSNQPYDAIVRQMITDTGLWTGRPATNFITATINEGDVDENKLAARCVRAFLGQRIDCAQCHDHPFDDWTQAEFEGLAAHFGQTQQTMVGIEDKLVADKKPVEYRVEDRKTLKERVVQPAVPFNQEWLPKTGSRREKLAAWITHPQNRRFERAIVNRVWGYLFGKPHILDYPVDDLRDPGDAADPDLLDILGADFREHGCDLRRLIRVIVGSRVFRLDSTHPADNEDVDREEVDRLLNAWAVFPLTRLRPEQIVGAMIQAGAIKTIDQNSHLFVRFQRFIRENDFIKEYGDLGENELDERAGTLPQALLRMNGELGNSLLGANPLTASGRIAVASGSDEKCLETCFLVCFTRRPTSEEKNLLQLQLKGKQRQQAVEDIYWSLFNSLEFSWNH
jgi:hypothetical protein